MQKYYFRHLRYEQLPQNAHFFALSLFFHEALDGRQRNLNYADNYQGKGTAISLRLPQNCKQPPKRQKGCQEIDPDLSKTLTVTAQGPI